MKYLFSLILVFSELHAQCKFQIDEFTKIQSITNEIDRVTPVRSLGANYHLYLQFDWYQGYYYLTFYSMFPRIVSINTGEKCYFKLNDSTVITLINPSYKIAQRDETVGWGVTQSIQIDENDVDVILTKGIYKARIGNQEYEFYQKGNEKIAEQILCLRNKLKELKLE